MIQKVRSYLKEHYPLILSFWGPIILMLGYFIYRKMYPFGTSSILTVDMGQQYVDFFQFFRRTILHSPSSFFYTFSKAIGGEMLGEWAYYLLSPFNLILLFFPSKTIMAGIIVITLLKYGCAGYTFGRLLSKRNLKKGLLIPTFSTAYAFMGWSIANQLNLLWIDAIVFLPLIILGLLNLLDHKKGYAYSLWLAVMLIVNYYMAYMICLFLILFFIWYIADTFETWKTCFKKLWLFISRSLISVGIAAALLLPTFYSLQSSKGQYTQDQISAKLEYNPLKMLTKFVLGSFDFKQMPSGYPNLFVSSLVLFTFIMFFFNKKFSIKSRLTALVISIFFIVSMCFEPLDLLWHGMQFPVWYPYRFTFVVSFWMIFLAAKSFDKFNFSPTWWQIWLAFLLEAGILGYSWLKLNKVSYLNKTTLIFSALFAVLTLLLLSIAPKNNPNNIRNVFLYIIVMVEMTANVAFSLNNISYLSASEYSVPTASLSKDTQLLKKLDSSMYRTGQTYSRTKNDGIANGFNSGSYFSSALEKSIPDFYGQIGNPDGDNYVTYSNGTLITDGLLDMKYFFNQKDTSELTGASTTTTLSPLTEKSDLNLYRLVGNNLTTRIYKNPYASSLGYAANSTLKNLTTLYDDPITYQTSWLNAVTGTWPTTKYFTAQNFNEVIFQNATQTVNLTGAVVKRKNTNADSQIIFKFTPKTNNSYYLTLGSGLIGDNVSLYIGNRQLNYYSTFRHTVVVNIANHDKGQEIVITARFKKKTLTLNNFVLYEMNNKLVEQKLKEVKKQAWKIKKHSDRYLSGSISITKSSQIFTTTIPYSKGWHAYVDGKSVSTYKVQNTFLAFDISKGKHTITLSYWPPYLNLGIAISVISLIILFAPALVRRFYKPKLSRASRPYQK
ncbi:YfhO family protein [Ligilactobacillus sp. WILCCON 0076]|uniref:YfhO family protein n=1 Tax=Ligilactobacillus ubinensis TaxID=2876789 RepID=A0A9X2JLA9_9LACO|nr:YfhO family protein [Ligilactobacillus ubinensis]MCP0886798.1 YfhO family protein [Ligilactobacillus ubinensis]